MAAALAEHFTAEEVSAIMAAAKEPEYKNLLTETTKRVVEEKGAFGCPWFWVRNGEGKEEPFFGSDRWHFMWDFLKVPSMGMEVLGKGKEEGRARL